jgi:hypothetical protein
LGGLGILGPIEMFGAQHRIPIGDLRERESRSHYAPLIRYRRVSS